MAISREPSTLVRIAKLHFEENLPQKDIAKLLGTSVSTISRALQQAREHGLIQIRIVEPSIRRAHLEEALKRSFGLKAAVVVPSSATIEQTRVELGQAVASYLEPHLFDDMTIGVSDGRTTASIVADVQHSHVAKVQVVPLLGGVGEPDVYTHPIEVARMLAKNLGGHTRHFNAPAIVHTPEIRRALLDDPTIRTMLSIIRNCDIALLGIGAVLPETTLHHVLTPEQVAEAKKLNATGAICARFYDREGKAIASELDDRTLAISLHDLRQLKHSIGAAVGMKKFEAVHAALRGHVVNVLATDQDVALALLDRAGER